MTLLKSEEYNISYFDQIKARELGLPENPAGYSQYELDWSFSRWLDEFIAKVNPQAYQGKKVLDFGCAKGYVVQKLRNLGVDAYGIDVSQYAIDNAPEDIKPYLTVGDARTALISYQSKKFDLVMSMLLLECIPEADLPALIQEMNRISKFQVHFIDEITSPDYYLKRSLSWWRNQGFAKNTKLIGYLTGEEATV